MDASAWILLVQAITTLVLVWYTWETRKIRLDQGRQNKLIADQLEIMQQSLDFELQKDARASEPLFRFEGVGGRYLNNSDECEFINEGGPITQVSIHADPRVKASVWPTESIQNHEKGNVTFVSEPPGAPMPAEVAFEIRFMNCQGKLGTRNFRMRHGSCPVKAG